MHLPHHVVHLTTLTNLTSRNALKRRLQRRPQDHILHANPRGSHLGGDEGQKPRAEDPVHENVIAALGEGRRRTEESGPKSSCAGWLSAGMKSGPFRNWTACSSFKSRSFAASRHMDCGSNA